MHAHLVSWLDCPKADLHALVQGLQRQSWRYSWGACTGNAAATRAAWHLLPSLQQLTLTQ